MPFQTYQILFRISLKILCSVFKDLKNINLVIVADNDVLSNLSREQICSRTATNWENCDEKDHGSALFIKGGPDENNRYAV